MQTKSIFFFFCVFQISSFLGQSNDSLMKLSGKVTISILDGTIECDMTLSNIPHIEDYFIRINSGLNILHFKCLEPNEFLTYYEISLFDTLSTGESNAYYFADNTRKGKYLPSKLQIKYLGKYPVVRDTLNDYMIQDWKGNLAFNGYSLRADGYQSAWYPVIYDVKKDKTYEELIYDIEVVCKDCSTLYLNGSKPIKGTSARFKTEKPYQITMYCGDYSYAEFDGITILNSDLNQAEGEEFRALINQYQNFYFDNLKIAASENVNFIQTTPSSKDDGFLFVSYPTIMNIGYGDLGLRSLLDPEKGKWFRPYIAHELGHFYFGSILRFNSEIGDALSEGFAEYLSLLTTEKLIDKEVYKKIMNDKKNYLSDFKAIPLGHVKSGADYEERNTYVYDYVPIILKAIEKEIGEAKMWQWMQTILKSHASNTNYDFLISTLDSIVKNPKVMAKIQKDYFESSDSIKNAFNIIEDSKK